MLGQLAIGYANPDLEARSSAVFMGHVLNPNLSLLGQKTYEM